MATQRKSNCRLPQNKASVRQTTKKTVKECPTSIVETRTVVTVTRRPKPKATTATRAKKACTTCAVKKATTAKRKTTRKPRAKKVVIKGLLPAPKPKRRTIKKNGSRKV